MEFIFELFAQMFGGDENTVDSVADVIAEQSPVADFDTEANELPLADMNLFEVVNFH